MSGDGLYTGIGIGVIFGFALCFVAVALCMAAKEADQIGDEERLQALRDKGIL